MIGPSDGQRGGVLIAWDPVTQTERWRKEGGGASGGGTLTTASNLLFQVLPDGRLIVYSADKGEKLHEINTGLRRAWARPSPTWSTASSTSRCQAAVVWCAASGRTRRSTGGGVRRCAGRGGAPAVDPTPTPPRILTFALDGTAQVPGDIAKMTITTFSAEFAEHADNQTRGFLQLCELLRPLR